MVLILSCLILASPVGQRLYEEAQHDLEDGALQPAESKLRRALTLVDAEGALAAWIWLALAGIAEQEGEDCEVVKRYQRYLVYAANQPDEAASMARASRRLRVAERRCESLVQISPPLAERPHRPLPEPDSKLLGKISLGLGIIFLGAGSYELIQAISGRGKVNEAYKKYEEAENNPELYSKVEEAVADQRRDVLLSSVFLGTSLVTLGFGLYRLSKTSQPDHKISATGHGLQWEISF